MLLSIHSSELPFLMQFYNLSISYDMVELGSIDYRWGRLPNSHLFRIPHYRDDDHREDALHFTIKARQFIGSFSSEC